MGGFISVSGLGQSWVIFHRTILSHGGCRRRPLPRFLVLSRLWHADYFTCPCLGTNCKVFFVWKINFPIECKWSAIQNNKHLVKKPKRWFQLWFSGIDDDDEGNVDVDDDFYQYRGTKWLLANPIVTLSVWHYRPAAAISIHRSCNELPRHFRSGS